MDQMSEITIVGSGPAGIAAAIYLKRAGLDPFILEKNEPGGLIRNSYYVENYPGFPKGITGYKLADCFIDQLNALGLTVIKSKVEYIDTSCQGFKIETNTGQLSSFVVIVATGTNPKKLSINGSNLIEGTHLFYEPKLVPQKKQREKERVLVIGGGDIAFDYTLSFLKQGYDVAIVCHSKPKCLPLLYSRVIENGAEIYAEYFPEEIIKTDRDLILRCRQDNKIEELHSDWIIVACGREPNMEFLSQKLRRILEKNNRIPETSIPGFYLAGDVIRGQCRQVGIAVGDGIHAAMLAEKYIKHELARI